MVVHPRAAALALTLVLSAAIAGCGSGEPPASAGRSAALTGPAPSSAALRSLEAQRNRLLEGGTDRFRRTLAGLRGHPVVVNQWASWCPPCRAEFPFFQRLAAKYRGRVAFLGVDSNDSRGDAKQFLRQFPTPYPHYFDPDVKIARLFRGGQAWPTTAYYNARGEVSFSHLGGYATKEKLDEDIRRYALRG